MPIEQFPFIKGNLAEADFGEILQPAFGMWEIEGRDDIIIREESDRVRSWYDSSKEGLGARTEIYKKGKKLFDDLRTKYDINVIPFNYVISKTDEHDDPQIFTITKKISGKNIREMNQVDNSFEENEKLSNDADQLISLLAKYAKDRFSKNSIFLNDIFHYHQYVLGKTEGDKDKKLYLVDTDPFYVDLSQMHSDKNLRDQRMIETLQSLQVFVTQVEQLTSVKLKSAREEMKKLFDCILSSCSSGGSDKIIDIQTEWEKMMKYNEDSGLYKNETKN